MPTGTFRQWYGLWATYVMFVLASFGFALLAGSERQEKYTQFWVVNCGLCILAASVFLAAIMIGLLPLEFLSSKRKLRQKILEMNGVYFTDIAIKDIPPETLRRIFEPDELRHRVALTVIVLTIHAPFLVFANVFVSRLT